MKKWIAILLCLCLIAALAACSERGDSGLAKPDGEPVSTGEPAASDTVGTGETEPSDEPADTPVNTDTVISTEAESYVVTVTEMVPINATFETSGVGIYLSYASENEQIATVSKYGKVKGVSEGTTRIIITSSDGAEKIVSVTVEKRVVEKVVRLALNVMWNDNDLGCYNNETGPVLEITEDGRYTLTFDCADLSEDTKALGVTGLNNLTSIYIKDYDVTTGELMKSNVLACMIRWDKIVVDGVELTITNNEFKDAMKITGIFDTNDPFNAWDGSSVAEVTVDTENHVLNINLEDPQTVSVTFTLSGLTFYE